MAGRKKDPPEIKQAKTENKRIEALTLRLKALERDVERLCTRNIELTERISAETQSRVIEITRDEIAAQVRGFKALMIRKEAVVSELCFMARLQYPDRHHPDRIELQEAAWYAFSLSDVWWSGLSDNAALGRLRNIILEEYRRRPDGGMTPPSQGGSVEFFGDMLKFGSAKPGQL